MEYVQSGKLLTIQKAEEDILNSFSTKKRFEIPLEDFLCGIADLTGELMRACVDAVTAGQDQFCFQCTDFMRVVYDGFCNLPINQWSELYKKIGVMESSVKKAENVCFTIKVRGSEYPKELLNLDYSQYGSLPYSKIEDVEDDAKK